MIHSASWARRAELDKDSDRVSSRRNRSVNRATDTAAIIQVSALWKRSIAPPASEGTTGLSPPAMARLRLVEVV